MRSADDPYSTEWQQPRYQSNAQWVPAGSNPPAPNRQGSAPAATQWQQATQVPTSANAQQRPAGKVVEIPVVRVSSGSQQPRDIPIRVERAAEQPSPAKSAATQPAAPQPAPQAAAPPREDAAAAGARPAAPEVTKVEQSKSQFDVINAVLQEAQQLEERVRQFSKTHKDREYLLLDDLLSRCIHDLDQVEANGDETVRQARRDAIRKIQSVMDHLDEKSGKKPAAASDLSLAPAAKLKKTSGK